LENSVFIVRTAFVLLTLLLLANCAAQIDPAKYALAEGDKPVRATYSQRHFAKTDIDYDGRISRATPDVSKVDIGKPTAGDVGLSRKDLHQEPIIPGAEETDAGFGRHTVRAAMRSVQPKDSSPAANSRFLETLAKDDRENQLLKLKTNICRGC
jgi:hypothetical protein